jgi:hypothetical protein
MSKDEGSQQRWIRKIRVDDAMPEIDCKDLDQEPGLPDLDHLSKGSNLMEVLLTT